MPFSYLCPRCKANLSPNVRVVLVARYNNHKGLVLMSRKPGDYHFICDKGFCKGFKRGDTLEFFCPVCAQSLNSPHADHFTELLMVDPRSPERKPWVIRFSRVSEEHATFVYDGATVKAFGEDAQRFQNQMVIEGDWSW
jgi:hypothetical protein